MAEFDMLDLVITGGKWAFQRLTQAGRQGAPAGPPQLTPPPAFSPPTFPRSPVPTPPPVPGDWGAPRIEIGTVRTGPDPDFSGGDITGMLPDAPGAPETRPMVGDRESYQSTGEIASQGILEADFSYSADVAQGIACAACTKDHLVTMAAAAKALEAARRAGDEETARYQVARIAAEAAALQRYDWTPEKIAATPPDRLVPVAGVQPAILRLAGELPTPPDLALAWGACDEAIRFAQGAMTDRDRAEIAARIADVDEKIAYTERVTLGPEHTRDMDPEQVAQARQALRRARHILAQGDPFQAGTLGDASRELSQAAVILTPAPDVATATRLRSELDVAKARFYRSYFRLGDHHG